MKKVLGSIICLLATASLSAAAVNVEVNTPNASVRVGTPPPAPQVTVIEQQHYHDAKTDNGKHKGHKKHKKHKKEHHDDNGRHER